MRRVAVLVVFSLALSLPVVTPPGPAGAQAAGGGDPGILDAGVYHSVALTSDGTPWAWGYNTYGQLGDGTTANRTTPVPVTGLSGVTNLSAGGYHSLAVASDGSVWAWGHNASGELGDGTTTDSSVPVQVAGLSTATDVDGGSHHSLALDAGGTVWSWGTNGAGQLGDGTTTARTTPVQVLNLTDVTAIAAGGMSGLAGHSLALRSDGTVWAWGNNNKGQLGDGSTSSRSAPVQVSGLGGVVAIAANGANSYALKDDGGVWAWGDNSSDQLADSSAKRRSSTPVQSAISDVVAIAAGAEHALAVKADGTAWAWGKNDSGQLGDGNSGRNASSATPVRSGSLTDATALAGGHAHSLAALGDGSAWAWGLNFFGQLGDGTTATRTTPVQVSGLGNIGPPASDDTPPSVALTSPPGGATVFHTTLVEASASDNVGVDRVEFLVDGVVAHTDGSAPYEFAWDTTTVADGDRLLEARAVDGAGLTATDGIGVAVANGTSTQERLDADFAEGALSVDDYVRYALWTVTGNHDELPARYSSVDAADEASGWVFTVLTNWESLSAATQDELAAYLTPVEETQTSAQLQTANDHWVDCEGLLKRIFNSGFACETSVAGFDLHYNVDGPFPVDLTDADGDDVPDVIEQVGATLVAAKDFYVNTLNFDDRPTVDIWFDFSPAGAVSLPAEPLPGASPDIYLAHDIESLSYLPAHELFHQHQYEYMNAFRAIPNAGTILWWMEATAEWGAHWYTDHAGTAAPEKYSYSASIDNFLRDPHNELTRLGIPLGGASQYGAFLLPEYLDMVVKGDSVRDTWVEIDTGFLGDDPDARKAIDRMLQAHGRTLAGELPSFWDAVYPLDFPPVGADHVDFWRTNGNTLEERAETQGDGVVSTLNRMARASDERAGGGDPAILLSDGDSAVGDVAVQGGGAAVLEIKPDAAGTLRIELEGSLPGLDVSVLPLDGYAGSPCAAGDVTVDGTGTTFTATVDFVDSCAYVAVLVTNPDAFQWFSTLVSYDIQFGEQVDSTVTNGLIRLGIHPEGHLNVPGFDPSSGTGTTTVGLRYLPTGADALAPGCLCEGWGAADLLSGASGWGNESYGGTSDLTVVKADFDADSGVSSVMVGPLLAPVLRVTHEYKPVPETPNLYRIDVEMRNITSVDAGNLDRVHALYRRVMDWDVEPTAFSEYVTIETTGPGVPSAVATTTNDGFASPDPLDPPTDLGATGFFVDFGPMDHGALIDLDFGLLDPGESVTFTMYYGAAGNEADAWDALQAVGAEMYSFGQPDTIDGHLTGEPNTFIWAYTAPAGSASLSTMSSGADAEPPGSSSGPGTNRNATDG